MRRWPWVLLGIVVLAVVLGATAFWWVTTQQMQDQLAAWVAARRADGWTVTAVAPQAGGWPFEADLTLRDFELHGGAADLPGGLSWRADEVVLRLSPHDANTLEIEAVGLQHLRLSSAPDIAYTAHRLVLLVPLNAAPTAQPLELQGDGLRARIPIGNGEDPFSVDRLDVHAVLHPGAARGQPAASVTATARDIALPPHVDWALGPTVRSLAVDAALDGPVPATMDGPAPAASVLTQRATAWRNGGGTLDVQHIRTQWGPLQLTATATLLLDGQMQPTGSAKAEVIGYGPTLDELARHGVMPASAATAAKAVLSLLAVTPRDGGPTEVAVPLSLHDGLLSIHNVPLLKLPQLDWPPS